jgi:hypothetical protein
MVALLVVLGLASASWACSGAGGDGELFGPGGALEEAPDAETSADAAPPGRDGGATHVTDAAETDAGIEDDVDAGDCGAPAALHPRDLATGVYCPFRPGASNCAVGEHCCQPFSGSSACAASCAPAIADAGKLKDAAGSISTTFTGTDWECQGPTDCATGVCCGLTQVQPATCGLAGKLFRGARCQTGCAAALDEIALCDRPTQCGATERCAPFRARGAELGACVPR